MPTRIIELTFRPNNVVSVGSFLKAKVGALKGNRFGLERVRHGDMQRTQQSIFGGPLPCKNSHPIYLSPRTSYEKCINRFVKLDGSSGTKQEKNDRAMSFFKTLTDVAASKDGMLLYPGITKAIDRKEAARIKYLAQHAIEIVAAPPAAAIATSSAG